MRWLRQPRLHLRYYFRYADAFANAESAPPDSEISLSEVAGSMRLHSGDIGLCVQVTVKATRWCAEIVFSPLSVQMP